MKFSTLALLKVPLRWLMIISNITLNKINVEPIGTRGYARKAGGVDLATFNIELHGTQIHKRA